MKNNKKGQFIGALNVLSQSAIQMFIFALVITVTLLGVQSVKDSVGGGVAGASLSQNATWNNITLVQNGIANFPQQSGLITIVVVFSVIILLVSSAFGGGKR